MSDCFRHYQFASTVPRLGVHMAQNMKAIYTAISNASARPRRTTAWPSFTNHKSGPQEPLSLSSMVVFAMCLAFHNVLPFGVLWGCWNTRSRRESIPRSRCKSLPFPYRTSRCSNRCTSYIVFTSHASRSQPVGLIHQSKIGLAKDRPPPPLI